MHKLAPDLRYSEVYGPGLACTQALETNNSSGPFLPFFLSIPSVADTGA
jgi:hypothetical protein